MCHDPAACDEAIAYWDALYAAETVAEAQLREEAERAVRERETAMASMSEARLAEIRNWFDGESHSITDDMAHDLLAEVSRLRAREAALVVVVERVAETGADFDMNTGNSWLLFPGLYAAEQCREQARALLAIEPTAAE